MPHFYDGRTGLNKEFNAYYEQSKDTYGVEYVRCRISAIKEEPASKDLIVHYVQPNGQPANERFDMVVLSVGTQPPAQAQATAEALGIELNPYGFCETDKFAPLQTSQPGVYVCGAFQSPKEIAETIIDAAGAAGDVMRLMRASLGQGKSSRNILLFVSRPMARVLPPNGIYPASRPGWAFTCATATPVLTAWSIPARWCAMPLPCLTWCMPARWLWLFSGSSSPDSTIDPALRPEPGSDGCV